MKKKKTKVKVSEEKKKFVPKNPFTEEERLMNYLRFSENPRASIDTRDFFERICDNHHN